MIVPVLRPNLFTYRRCQERFYKGNLGGVKTLKFSLEGVKLLKQEQFRMVYEFLYKQGKHFAKFQRSGRGYYPLLAFQ